jgi:putative peptide zinc metalloprotease protein
MYRRFEKKEQRKWKQKVRNPMAVSFSLYDPEKLLTRLEPLSRIVFSWPAAVLWLIAVGFGVMLAGYHWPDLTENISDRVLAPQNLVLMWFLFPVIKVFHELGHALAVKRLGGEVHDVGIMLLVLTPIPYIDASSSLAFRSKWERIMVGGAGLLVEAFIAAVMLMVWINVEPGAARGVIYNIVIIAGVSSVFFNGNPLLRYDAYYILSDLLEIPNLGTRANQYLAYLLQRYVLFIQDIEAPNASRYEKNWFVLYGTLSFVYRIFIYIAIIQFIAGKFFVVGIILALWAIISMMGLPLVKAGRFLFTSPKLGRKRQRAIAISAVVLALVVGFITLIPLPLATVTEGVVWLPEEAIVRVQTEGFVEEVKVSPGQRVAVGTEIVRCSDPLLSLRLKVLEAQLNELKVEYYLKEQTDRVQAQIVDHGIKEVQGQIKDARERLDLLTARSTSVGSVFVPQSQDLIGRFVRRGEVIGYVLEKDTTAARVAVTQSDADLVRRSTRRVDVRLAESFPETLQARMIREVPAATEDLPARVLGASGGGTIAIDPRDERGLKAFQKMFFFDVELPSKETFFNVGGRVYVRFDHGWEPVGGRWYRSIRNLLLRRFNV